MTPRFISSTANSLATGSPTAVLADAASALGIAVVAGGLALAIGITTARAAAPEVKLLGTFKDWSAYTTSEGDGKVCFIFSRPKKKDPAAAKRGDSFMQVTHRPKMKKLDVVSLNLGYTFKKNSTVAVKVGKADFALFTDGTAAWARDEGTDHKIVDTLLKGASLTAKGTSDGGASTTDTYSLDGIGQAYTAINQACGVKH